MRGRALVVLTGLAMSVVLVGAVSGLSRSARGEQTTVSVSIRHLAPEDAVPLWVALPAENGNKVRVFVVRERDGHVLALLGRADPLGCGVEWRGDFGGLTVQGKDYAFDDPCGGSPYTLDGTCRGGPCHRGLDRFAVTVERDRATVDLSSTIPGRRPTSARPEPIPPRQAAPMLLTYAA